MSRNVDITKRLVEHGKHLLDLFPHCTETDPVKLCKKLRRLELDGERLVLDYCNGAIESKHFESGSDKLLAKVNAVLQFNAESSAVIPVFLNGDPRGYALKIENEWMRENAKDSRLHRDWAEYGILVPDF